MVVHTTELELLPVDEKAEGEELKSVHSIVLPKLVSQPLPLHPIRPLRAARGDEGVLEQAKDDWEERGRIELVSAAELDCSSVVRAAAAVQGVLRRAERR